MVGVLIATALSGVSFGQAWSSSGPPPRMPDFSLRATPPAPSPPTRIWVHLYGAADLERLRATNPNHFLRAQPILAAANEICQPGRHMPTRRASRATTSAVAAPC